MKVLIKIGKVAELLSTTPAILRLFEYTGELIPDRKMNGCTRYYDIDKIKPDYKSHMPCLPILKKP